MPSRRSFLLGCTALAAAGSPAVTAAGATVGGAESVDPAATVDALRTAGERAFGRVDVAAVDRLDERLEAPDRRTAAALDRRVVPVFGRGRGTRAGLQSLAGRPDPAAVADRLGRFGPVRPAGRADGHRLHAVGSGSGRATVGHRGDALVAGVPLADVGDAATARTVAGIPAASPAARRVAEGLRGAAAFTGVVVAGDAPSRFRPGHPLRSALDEVAAFGLGVEETAGGPVVRVRVLGDGAVTRADALALLRGLGLPVGALDGVTARADGRVLDLRAGLDSRSDGGSAVLLLLLLLVAAVVGTFVLGLGDTTEPTVPQVSLAFGYDGDTGRVTVTHSGGDTLGSRGRVLVRYTHDGREVTERWRESDGIGAGDRYTTEQSVDPGTRLTVVWQGEESAVLGSFEVPG